MYESGFANDRRYRNKKELQISVSIVTKLLAKQPGNEGSISGINLNLPSLNSFQARCRVHPASYTTAGFPGR
jgi:hypothetical protein